MLGPNGACPGSRLLGTAALVGLCQGCFLQNGHSGFILGALQSLRRDLHLLHLSAGDAAVAHTQVKNSSFSCYCCLPGHRGCGAPVDGPWSIPEELLASILGARGWLGVVSPDLGHAALESSASHTENILFFTNPSSLPDSLQERATVGAAVSGVLEAIQLLTNY